VSGSRWYTPYFREAEIEHDVVGDVQLFHCSGAVLVGRFLAFWSGGVLIIISGHGKCSFLSEWIIGTKYLHFKQCPP
jgi:hypothetical protein